MSKMVGFNYERLEQTCKEHNMTVYDAGELVGRSKTYFVTCKNNNKVNNSALSRFYELVRHIPKNEYEQQSFDFIINDSCLDQVLKRDPEDKTDKLAEDRKIVEKYGYEKICRLYSLACFLKENGYIGG